MRCNAGQWSIPLWTFPIRSSPQLLRALRATRSLDPDSEASTHTQSASARKKNARLAGRSASRRMKYPYHWVPNGHVHPHLVTGVGQPSLLIVADAIQHLVFEIAGADGPIRVPDAGTAAMTMRVVRGDHRIAGPRHQHLQAPQVRVGDRIAVTVGHRRRFVIGALAQPDSRAGRGELRQSSSVRRR